MFHLGQQVVCIDDSVKRAKAIQDMHGLKKGNIYIIRWVGEMIWPFFGVTNPLLYIRVEEIIRPTCCGHADLPYLATRFKPLKTTDISIFTEMLTKLPETIDG